MSNYDNGKLFEECDSGNRLIIHGLKAFKIDDNHESIFKNLLRAWNDPGRLCVTDIERKCLYQLLPCVYAKKRYIFVYLGFCQSVYQYQLMFIINTSRPLDEETETVRRTRTRRKDKGGSNK